MGDSWGPRIAWLRDTLYGSIAKGRIELVSPAALPEGAKVEVIVQPNDEESAFEAELLQEGVISFCSDNGSTERFRDYHPVPVEGKPVSETIIEERR